MDETKMSLEDAVLKMSTRIHVLENTTRIQIEMNKMLIQVFLDLNLVDKLEIARTFEKMLNHETNEAAQTMLRDIVNFAKKHTTGTKGPELH